MAQKVSSAHLFHFLKKKLSRIPKPKSYTPVLVGLLLIAVFLLGMLVTKVQYLEQNGQTYPSAGNGNTQAQTTTAPNQPLHVAQAIGMDPNKFQSCLQSGKYANQVSNDFKLGQSAGVTGTPSVFINGSMIVGAQPYAVFKTAIDQELANPGSPVPSATPSTVDVSKGPFPIMGSQNAPVKIVEFADFQCPFCEQWFRQTEAQIINDYVKTGKANFQFQNYAFLGADSTTAAEAAYCANDQGKFWEFHNFMYQHQGQEESGWASVKNLL